MTTQVSSNKPVKTKTTTSALTQTFVALAIGLVIILFVGFAPMGVAHNAAHDVRHSVAFPCH